MTFFLDEASKLSESCDGGKSRLDIVDRIKTTEMFSTLDVASGSKDVRQEASYYFISLRYHAHICLFKNYFYVCILTV